VTCTDGGWVPESARLPETTTDVPVGAIRAFEFTADAPGDWAFHCHKSHHTMNAMGHNIRNFIGANQRGLETAVRRLVPDYVSMGSGGMAEMGTMRRPLPDNTLPMMTGFGQFGPIEMGGMFTVMKVRDGLAAGDYSDPARIGTPKERSLMSSRMRPPNRPGDQTIPQARRSWRLPSPVARQDHMNED
jgi:hypothetical protein